MFTLNHAHQDASYIVVCFGSARRPFIRTMLGSVLAFLAHSTLSRNIVSTAAIMHYLMFWNISCEDIEEDSLKSHLVPFSQDTNVKRDLPKRFAREQMSGWSTRQSLWLVGSR